jgi:hypothetical protein
MLVIDRVLTLLKEGLRFEDEGGQVENDAILRQALLRYRLAEELLKLLIQENGSSFVEQLSLNKKTVTMQATALEKRLSRGEAPPDTLPGQSAAKPSKQAAPTNGLVSFDDVIGNTEAKRALYESVVMKTALPAELFQGCRIPVQKILLFGPPGCDFVTLLFYLIWLTSAFALNLEDWQDNVGKGYSDLPSANSRPQLLLLLHPAELVPVEIPWREREVHVQDF